jgi:hypothetical protein
MKPFQSIMAYLDHLWDDLTPNERTALANVQAALKEAGPSAEVVDLDAAEWVIYHRHARPERITLKSKLLFMSDYIRRASLRPDDQGEMVAVKVRPGEYGKFLFDAPGRLFPDLTSDEYKALREDINVRGVQVPVELDEDGYILDGYHRWKICQELHKACPSVERKGLTEDQKLEHILKLNLARRHLTRDALDPVALKLRQRSWSHQRIAKALGVGSSTVHRWLTDVSHTGHVATPAVVTDTRGRQQPARKARTPKSIDGAAPDETVAEEPTPPPTACPPDPRLAETASTPADRVPEPGAPVLIPSHPLAPLPSAGRPIEPEPTRPLPTALTGGSTARRVMVSTTLLRASGVRVTRRNAGSRDHHQHNPPRTPNQTLARATEADSSA